MVSSNVESYISDKTIVWLLGSSLDVLFYRINNMQTPSKEINNLVIYNYLSNSRYLIRLITPVFVLFLSVPQTSVSRIVPPSVCFDID